MNYDMGEPAPNFVKSDLPSLHAVVPPMTQHLYEENCCLRRRNAQLVEMLFAAYERIAAQSELLSRIAE